MSEQIRAYGIEFEQKTDYLVFHNLESVKHRQALARWPLHITIVPSFSAPDSSEDTLRELVREIASDYTPFSVRPGDEAKFGPSLDVPVTKVIDTTGELRRLHERFMRDLGSIGCNEIDATYAHERYNPHFTWKRGVFPPTDSFILDTLSIAKKTGDVKTMIETTRLEY